MRNIVAAASEFEIELTRERLADARASLKERGKRVAGRVPFGYQSDRATKALKTDTEQSLIVQQLFEMASQGIKTKRDRCHANASEWKNHRDQTGNGRLVGSQSC